MGRISLKWVEENYSYDDIVGAAPEIEQREEEIHLIDGYNLQEIIDKVDQEYPNIAYKDMHFHNIGSWDDIETVLSFYYEHTLTELERFKKGRLIIQERERKKQKKKKKEEKERKELERLTKKFGENK